MSFLISNTLGLVSKKYCNLDEWLVIHRELVLGGSISKKTKENRERHIKDISRAIGDLTLASIRPCDISRLINSVANEHPAKAKRLLIELRCIFNSALENGWIDTNPANAVRTVRAPTLRERLTLDMWRRIYLRANTWGRRLLLLALVTGQRRGDLVKMRFKDVYGGYLHVVQAKTGAKVALPLSLCLPQIATTLEFAIAECVDYSVNPDYLLRKTTGEALSESSLSYKFECMRNAEFPEMAGVITAPSLHECRSLSARLYDGIVDTQKLLGHSSATMTAVYHKPRNLKTDEYQVVQ